MKNLSKMKNIISVGSIALITLVVACGSQLVEFPEDNHTDASFVDANLSDATKDVSIDALTDSPIDVMMDSMMDAPSDVLMEAMIDASLDSSLDSMIDAPLGCVPVLGSDVNLGTAGNFAILTKSGISTVPSSAITGDIGVSPIAASAITGFSLTAPPTTFSTSTQVTGKVYASDYDPPTPANMTTAISDMETAFTDAAGRAPSFTELGAGNIGGMTLAPGVYKWGTGLLIPTNVTLQGNCADVWIFEIAQDLTMSSATNILLSGGALAKHIFWQVSGRVDLGTTSHFEGIILTQTAVAMGTSASINGRLLAQTAVTLDQNMVVQP